MYKVVIFDVDGTLIDTERSIIMGLHQMLKEETSKEFKEEYLDFVLGIPGKESIKEFNLDDPVLCLQKWKDNMAELRHFNEVYDGIITTLAKLKEKQVKTGIVTSRTLQECLTDPILNRLKSYFDHVVCADDTQLHKPNGEPLLRFLEDMGVDASEAVYIGDTLYDSQCAQNANVPYFWAGWGTKEDIDKIELNVLMHPYEIFELMFCHKK